MSAISGSLQRNNERWARTGEHTLQGDSAVKVGEDEDSGHGYIEGMGLWERNEACFGRKRDSSTSHNPF